MPTFWQVAIPFAVALTAIGLTAWINIHIKFAATRDVAVEGLKDFALNIIRWSMTALTGYLLMREVFSSGPVTRRVVFMITYQTACLTIVLIMTVVARLNMRMWKSTHGARATPS